MNHENKVAAVFILSAAMTLFSLFLAAILGGCTTFQGPNTFYTSASLFDSPFPTLVPTATPKPIATPAK